MTDGIEPEPGPNPTTRYKCPECGDIIDPDWETGWTMQWCKCKAIGVDAEPGSPYIRISGHPEVLRE